MVFLGYDDDRRGPAHAEAGAPFGETSAEAGRVKSAGMMARNPAERSLRGRVAVIGIGEHQDY